MTRIFRPHAELLLIIAITAALIVALAGQTRGQSPWASVHASPWSTVSAIAALPTPPAVPEPAWTIMPGDNSEPYADVHSRLNNGYRDVHEATHQLNNSLNNRWGFYRQHRYALYCLQGRIADISEPPLTLADVAAAVPIDNRCDGYQLYLIDQQRYWNRNPCYILDEWVAYSNEWEWDHTDIGLRHAVAFCDYAQTLLDLAERCRGYDATRLRTFIRWHKARVANQQSRARSMRAIPSPVVSRERVRATTPATPHTQPPAADPPATSRCPNGQCSPDVRYWRPIY